MNAVAVRTGVVRYNRKGDKGTKGARIRIRDWKSGMEWLCGAEGETWYDVAVYGDLLYLCLVSHTSGSVTPQQNVATSGGVKYWEMAQGWVFIATKLLLSERIKAEWIETEDIVARKLLTDGSGGHIELAGSEMKVFGTSAMNIRFGVREDGMAVLEYYNNDGRKLYDLGPEGITMIPVSEESWTKGYMQRLGDTVQAVLTAKAYKTKAYSETYACWQYHSKVVAGVTEDADNNLRWFAGKDKTGARLSDGIYRMMPASAQGNNVFGIHLTGNTLRVLTTDDLTRMSPYNETVYDADPLYTETLYTVKDGFLALATTIAYWNGSSSPVSPSV